MFVDQLSEIEEKETAQQFPMPISQIRPIFASRMPVPPGINQSYQVVRGRRRFILTNDARQFKADAAGMLVAPTEFDISLINAIRDAAEKGNQHKPHLQLIIRFFFPSLWKRDIDGGIKAVIDELFHHLELNDNLVTSLIVTKEISDDPHTEVELRFDLPHVAVPHQQ